MRAIVDKNKVVLYVAERIEGTGASMRIDGAGVSDIGDCAVIEDVKNVPTDFCGGKYLYDTGTFLVNPKYQEPPPPSLPIPAKTLEEKVDELSAKVDILITGLSKGL